MKADIVAISSLLTTTMDEMKTIVEELKKAGLRDNLKVLIGGAPITDEYAQEIGADAAAKDAAHGVRICKEWMRKVD
jgi:5-methyltetrahydrofolate--homocysteine methyltransferase